MECYCSLRNVQDFLAKCENSVWKTVWRIIQRANNPFGALFEYHPISPRDQARVHQFGKKVLSGIFLGCELVAV